MENDSKFGILLARQFQERLEIIKQYPEAQRVELLKLCVENEVWTSGALVEAYHTVGLNDDAMDQIIEDISQYNAEIEQGLSFDNGSGFFNSGKGDA